jgi:hypothetical protein
MQPSFSQIYPFLLAALVVWVVYRRLRRTFGKQVLHPVRMGVRIGVLVVIGCLLLPTSVRSMPFVGALLIGIAVGVALALWGASRTRFVREADQLYYLPHTYTGVAVSMLFLGRMVFRLIQAYDNVHAARAAGSDQALNAASMLQSPLTVGMFYVLMGYYVCYYAVVLYKSKHLTEADVAALPAPPN